MAVELRTVEKGGVARKKRAKSKYAYKLVLASDRWDLIRSWEKVREKLKQVNPFLPEKEFSIYLEDTLQVTRILKSQCHVKDVAQVQFSGVDVILCTGFSTTVTRWTLKANGRKCETDLLKFPYIISIFFYIVEIRVFVCLTLENLLVILVLSQGCIKEARRVEHLYNAQCLTYIKETKQIIAAGIGLLKYYSLSGIEVCVTIEKTGNIKTTMAKNEYIMQVLVDPSWRRLLVLGESGVYVINYMTMKQEFVLTGSQDAFAHISCCSVYQDKYIVTGSEVGIIRIWASFSFSKVKELEGHRRSITAVCCHPRQPLLFSSSTDGIIFIWRMDNFSKFRQVHTGDTVRRLGMMWDTGIVAMWCLVTDRIFIYEFCDFYIQFSSLESEVLHLQRLMGHGEHPNRIMVTTMDGGMKFLSPVTGSPLGFMYPVISLEKIDVFVYSAFRRNIYMLLKSGSILEVGCTTSPFQAVEVHESVNVDETVYCLISIFLVIQTGGAEIKDELILLGLCNGQISVLESESFTLPAPVQAHLGCVYCLESVAEVSLEEQVQYTTCRYILSAGSDNTVKLWYLRCYFTEHGPELAFHILAKIRCEMTPKRLSGTSERIFAVYDDQRTMAMFDICHLFNDSPHH
ncbi:WD repeat-containing protein 87-like [Pomacea canaliculata]|uniref:WD repeat-containing protein 87-like n=1 Tax=Pomacea canaliculata TaxID=400727 RepID=UPI000D73E048|nr:WD repeat-containing protein 87-like [Pomacea canaliculata]